jgi:hypothetical protein
MSRSGLLLVSTHDVLLRATNRWKELWHTVYSRNVSENMCLVGFTKHCFELCWLAQKILEVARSGEAKGSYMTTYMTSVPTDSMDQLHEFIKEHAERDLS